MLRLHLEDQQHVVFVGGEEANAVEQGRETELTAFFKLNAEEKEKHGNNFTPENMPKYVDMPGSYTFSNKRWQLRKKGFSIGRVHTVSPVWGDIFYLRMLLHHDHCRGKTSYKDLRTIDGNEYDTYQSVCRQVGLLSDDQEWTLVLTEAAVTQMCPQIRALYIVILMFCQPSDPRKLFDDFWQDWTDDFKRQGERRGYTFSEEQLKTMVRLDLQVRLQSHEQDLPNFGLQPMTDEEKQTVQGFVNIESAVIREEMDYDITELQTTVATVTTNFNEDQLKIFTTIMTSLRENASCQIFISARGGCGKTYILNGILDAVRASEPNGCIALAMATTGIAAQLLHLGRTYHSRMKAPLHPTENSTLNIKKQSQLSKLVQRAKLLLIDEATMLHRFQLEALDRTLRDLMDKPNSPFGGKIIILAGDYRQCLPVCPGSNRAQIVNNCINASSLWEHFQVFYLLENMRVRASGDPMLEAYDTWTLKIGDGTSNDINGLISIPEDMLYNIKPNTATNQKEEENSMKEFCRMIFPDISSNITSQGWLQGRSIIAPTNKEVDAINDMMEGWVPGTATKLTSADTLEDYRDIMRFNMEYVNTLCPNGFPRHVISLKPGMVIMLLRNISPKEGLCNGTKLIYERILNNKLLVCKLTTSDKRVLIPRIKFISEAGSYAFEWARRQFPVRIAFATTINKAQGQTLQKVGVWLRSPVFTHGQLYVASSRTGNPNALKFAIKQQQGEPLGSTANVVYNEVLLQEDFRNDNEDQILQQAMEEFEQQSK